MVYLKKSVLVKQICLHPRGDTLETLEDITLETLEDIFLNVIVCCRERELLCPILEEDNESTASGSVLNLQTGDTLNHLGQVDVPVLGSLYSTTRVSVVSGRCICTVQQEH